MKKKQLLVAFGAMILMLGGACDEQPAAPATPPVKAKKTAEEPLLAKEAAEAPLSKAAMRAQTAGELARKIRKSPDQAEAILGMAGYSPDEFYELMQEVAGDRDMHTFYIEALRGGN